MHRDVAGFWIYSFDLLPLALWISGCKPPGVRIHEFRCNLAETSREGTLQR